jgi:hypothetical protein
MVVSIEDSILTYIRIFSLNISWLTASTTAGMPVATGAAGLVGTGTTRVRMPVLL